MNATVQAAIDAGLAELEPVTDTPTTGLAYGSDLWCDSDLRADMKELDGDDPLVLAQAIARRLDCPRGALPDFGDYGISLSDMLSAGISTTALAGLANTIRAEITKDDRVDTVSVEVTIPDLSSLLVKIRIQPVDPSTTAFTLTLAVTSAAVLIAEVSSVNG